MWRKNQEPQAAAPVPSKLDTPKSELVKPEASKPEPLNTTAAKPEIAPAPAARPVSAAPPPPPAWAAVNSASTSSQAGVNANPAPIPAGASGDSKIGVGLKIRGEIFGATDMYIDGDVEGKVHVGSGRLTIGTNGRVQADLEAREIFVNGSVVGNLKASDRVQLGPSGSVEGSVTTPRIGIDDGARLRGKVETSTAGADRQAVQPAAKAKAMAANAESE